jgi:parallel beta-helix repeat protein
LSGGGIGPSGPTGATGPQGPQGEAADEAALVHKAGAETVTGAKTFNSGSFLDKGNLVYDVRAYSALFDGTTDDTTAIQAAMDAAATAGGGIVQLPEGTAIVETIVLGNHVALRGMGKYATILKLKDNTDAPVIENYVSIDDVEANAEFCAVLDLQIDGNKANNTSAAHGISFLTSPLFSQATNDDWFDTHQLVQNVMIVRCKGIGFTATGRAEMRLKNVYIEKCDSGGFDPTYDTYIETCSAGNNGVYGFNFTHGNIMAVGCKAFLSGRELTTNAPGFYISGLGLATTLAGCIAQNNNGQGFHLEDASGVILSGCVADSNNYGTGNADDAYAGVELDTVTNCRIEYTSTQGYQNGVLIGNQKHALRLIGDSNSNNISVVTYAQSPYVLGATLTTDSLPLMNHVEENGRVTNTGDAFTIARDKVLSQNGPRIRVFKRGNSADSHAAVTNGGELGGITGWGWDGSAYYEATRISMAAAQDFTGVNGGSGILFYTSANNGHSQALALQLRQNKSVLFYGDPLPNTNLSFSNGGASNYWLNTYSQVLHLNSTFSVSGSAAGIGTVTGDLRVTTAGTNAASVPTLSSTSTLSNKRITPRTGNTTSSATPTINTDTTDFYELTAQSVDITSFTTNLSGTPVRGQTLWIAITGTAARAITWGASFEASTVALPTTTVSTNRLDVGFIWNVATSKWRCVATC